MPAILWRKPTNSPTKFLGSGVLPAGAYVTLEHEHILILRKGEKRSFRGDEKRKRRESAIFWEERNAWFSDVWMDLPGVSQMLDEGGRSRSGAFPLELAHRLILMYSVRADVILDPFMGTGTTGLASAVAGRSSVGCEFSTEMGPPSPDRWDSVLRSARRLPVFGWTHIVHSSSEGLPNTEV